MAQKGWNYDNDLLAALEEYCAQNIKDPKKFIEAAVLQLLESNDATVDGAVKRYVEWSKSSTRAVDFGRWEVQGTQDEGWKETHRFMPRASNPAATPTNQSAKGSTVEDAPPPIPMPRALRKVGDTSRGESTGGPKKKGKLGEETKV